MKFRGLISTSERPDMGTSQRIQFAEINLAQEPLNNELVYNALSHLAEIPELNINLLRYENMRIYPNSARLNVDVLKYTEEKLKEAKAYEVRGSH